jgi:DHA2 family multidrug resistance protein
VTDAAADLAPPCREGWKFDDIRPFVGLLGVLLGSMMAVLGTRVTTFGLADLRGALGAGFDEGAWITTAFGLGQLLSGISSPYLASTLGARRVLLAGVAIFSAASLLAPLSPNLAAYLTVQTLGGIGSGTFIPVTIIFILRHLPKRLVIYGLAIYAMNSEFSQNVAASLEGFYTDYWSWRWISWQYGLALPLMFVCVLVGMPKDAPNDGAVREFDGPGLLYAWLGFGLLYAGIDQGNRLDWTRSGLVAGLLLAGALSLVAFVLRELATKRPVLKFAILRRPSLFVLFVLLAGFRFIILSTAYIIPTYLQTIQNFRGLDVGSVLLWIALPQFLLVLPLAVVLKRADPRWTLGVGAALMALACLMAASLTDEWATADFMPSQILQAVGQSLALTSIVVAVANSVKPEEAVTIGAFMQTSRLFGGEIGVAFMQTFVRVREQVHSNLLGLHVEGHGEQTMDRLIAYSQAIGSRIAVETESSAVALKLLANAIQRQATVLACIDGFQAAAAAALFCWLLAAFLPRIRPT